MGKRLKEIISLIEKTEDFSSFEKSRLCFLIGKEILEKSGVLPDENWLIQIVQENSVKIREDIPVHTTVKSIDALKPVEKIIGTSSVDKTGHAQDQDNNPESVGIQTHQKISFSFDKTKNQGVVLGYPTLLLSQDMEFYLLKVFKDFQKKDPETQSIGTPGWNEKIQKIGNTLGIEISQKYIKLNPELSGNQALPGLITLYNYMGRGTCKSSYDAPSAIYRFFISNPVCRSGPGIYFEMGYFEGVMKHLFPQKRNEIIKGIEETTETGGLSFTFESH